MWIHWKFNYSNSNYCSHPRVHVHVVLGKVAVTVSSQRDKGQLCIIFCFNVSPNTFGNFWNLREKGKILGM